MRVFTVFFVSFLLRLFLIPLPGFKADIAYWKWWGMSSANDGIVGPLINTAYNYPSFYLYILKATSHLYEFFTGFNFKNDPHNTFFWNDANFLYLFLIKLPYILADLGIGFLIYSIVKDIAHKRFNNKTAFIPLLSSCLYLFNPVVIYNSSIWGQTDSLGSLFILIAFYGLLRNNIWLIGIFSAVGLFMKTQTLIFLPILFLGVFLSTLNDSGSSNVKKYHHPLGLSKLIKTLWIFIATVIFINLPFLISSHMDRIFDIMYSSQLYFPYVSMNAYNLWWLFFGKLSSSFWDQNLILGLMTFKTAGVLLFGYVFSSCVFLLISDTRMEKINGKKQYHVISEESLLKSMILVSFAFFLLLTQMHERYLFPVFVFLPIYLGIAMLGTNRQISNIMPFVFYCLISLTTIINLHQVMVMNYPDNTLPFFPNSFNELLTKTAAATNVLLFIFLFILFTKTLPLKIKLMISSVFALAILFGSFPKMIKDGKKIISLTELKPVSVHQDFGALSVNKSMSNWWPVSLYYFFKHGLSTHANSQIVYNLSGKYRFFATNYGIDNDASTNASVVFKIVGDTKVLFQSEKIGRLTDPGFVKVNVENVQKLILIVNDAGDGINSDHADWLEPILYK